MNNPNPFIPQGSLLEQKNKKRANFKVAIYSIFGFNILLMSFFLIQGCSKKEPASDNNSTDMTANAPTNTPDTNTAPPPLSAPSNLVATPVVSNAPPPPPAPVPAPTPEPTAKEYTVVKGDSYYSIAKKFGVKMKEVEAANPSIAPTKLKVGMKLQIPEGGSSSGGAAPTADTGAVATDTYTVKSGDSLTKISKQFGCTVKALRAANDLKTDKIKVGQKLKVPEKAATADTTVAPSVAPSAPPASVSPAPSGAPGH
jgi:LysM repeat protein